ncbi:hypothetical protein BH09ACT10_BH09ACT10_10020 [soil metagenome]
MVRAISRAPTLEITLKSLAQILPIILLVAVFWFLVLRPARKRQHEAAQTQSELSVGSEIMLTSGIFGTVAAIHDDAFDLTISPGTTITVHKQAVARIIPVTVADDSSDETGE